MKALAIKNKLSPLQGTKVKGTPGRVLDCHIHMSMECINGDYKSTLGEILTDLQMSDQHSDIWVAVQGTKVEGTIGRLFEGHMHMFIECIDVDYKSTRRESFMDLQLDVKGCKDIYNSFDKYCEVEVMDGQNQYQTDDHGMQVYIHS